MGSVQTGRGEAAPRLAASCRYALELLLRKSIPLHHTSLVDQVPRLSSFFPRASVFTFNPAYAFRFQISTVTQLLGESTGKSEHL